MAKIFNDITETIGNTPLVRLNRIISNKQVSVLVKLEYFNPGSSVKDRIGWSMITNAEKKGTLVPGSTIIEPTSGNTGIGLALTAAVKGYNIILVMPESMSVERRKLLISLGAQLVLTDANKGMGGAIEQAQILMDNIKNSFMPQQFENIFNPQIHYETTGPEIWNDTNGKVDCLIAGVGTGGTISGAGRYLKEKNPDIKIFAVEPLESAVISGEPKGPHMIQGIGAGFIPDTFDMSVIDGVLKVSGENALTMAKLLSRKEGIIAGISAGANVYAANEIANKLEGQNKQIVTIVPDTGERYISTLLYHED